MQGGTCSALVLIRIVSAVAGVVRLTSIWQCYTISLASKFKPCKPLCHLHLLCGCETWTLLADFKHKESRLSRLSARGNFSTSPAWSTRPMTGCGARPASLYVHQNLFWQLSGDGNLHGSGMPHFTTASPNPSFRASWRMGDAMVGRGNAGWTASKSGHPCPCQNF